MKRVDLLKTQAAQAQAEVQAAQAQLAQAETAAQAAQTKADTAQTQAEEAKTQAEEKRAQAQTSAQKSAATKAEKKAAQAEAQAKAAKAQAEAAKAYFDSMKEAAKRMEEKAAKAQAQAEEAEKEAQAEEAEKALAQAEKAAQAKAEKEEAAQKKAQAEAQAQKKEEAKAQAEAENTERSIEKKLINNVVFVGDGWKKAAVYVVAEYLKKAAQAAQAKAQAEEDTEKAAKYTAQIATLDRVLTATQAQATEFFKKACVGNTQEVVRNMLLMTYEKNGFTLTAQAANDIINALLPLHTGKSGFRSNAFDTVERIVRTTYSLKAVDNVVNAVPIRINNSDFDMIDDCFISGLKLTKKNGLIVDIDRRYNLTVDNKGVVHGKLANEILKVVLAKVGKKYNKEEAQAAKAQAKAQAQAENKITRNAQKKAEKALSCFTD